MNPHHVKYARLPVVDLLLSGNAGRTPNLVVVGFPSKWMPNMIGPCSSPTAGTTTAAAVEGERWSLLVLLANLTNVPDHSSSRLHILAVSWRSGES